MKVCVLVPVSVPDAVCEGVKVPLPVLDRDAEMEDDTDSLPLIVAVRVALTVCGGVPLPEALALIV